MANATQQLLKTTHNSLLMWRWDALHRRIHAGFEVMPEQAQQMQKKEQTPSHPRLSLTIPREWEPSPSTSQGNKWKGSWFYPFRHNLYSLHNFLALDIRGENVYLKLVPGRNRNLCSLGWLADGNGSTYFDYPVMSKLITWENFKLQTSSQFVSRQQSNILFMTYADVNTKYTLTICTHWRARL